MRGTCRSEGAEVPRTRQGRCLASLPSRAAAAGVGAAVPPLGMEGHSTGRPVLPPSKRDHDQWMYPFSWTLVASLCWFMTHLDESWSCRRRRRGGKSRGRWCRRQRPERPSQCPAWHFMFWPSRTPPKAGSRMPIRRAMIAMTTSNSISVKAFRTVADLTFAVSAEGRVAGETARVRCMSAIVRTPWGENGCAVTLEGARHKTYPAFLRGVPRELLIAA